MKVNKTQAVLFMFVKLYSEKQISKEEIMSELVINDLTFARYIQELRAFIYNFYLDYEIIYQKSDNIYRLVKKQ